MCIFCYSNEIPGEPSKDYDTDWEHVLRAGQDLSEGLLNYMR